MEVPYIALRTREAVGPCVCHARSCPPALMNVMIPPAVACHVSSAVVVRGTDSLLYTESIVSVGLIGREASPSAAARDANFPFMDEPKAWSLEIIFAVTSTVSAAPNRRKIVVPSVAQACATPPTISVVTQVTAP